MSAAAVSVARPPIIVDLDGTLVLTDTFAASICEAVRRHPRNLFLLFWALLRGKAFCKQVIAAAAGLNAASLPYNQPLLDYLRQKRAEGQRLILATGADQSIANEVANHLGIFDAVISSDGSRNVTGEEKLRAIREQIGDMPFTYAGNSRVDLSLWRHAQSAVLVGAPKSCARALEAENIAIDREFEISKPTFKVLARCLRYHQWSKNILVFAPVILSHQIWNVLAVQRSLLAFIALCCCASALYIFNDLLDLQADREHPKKRFRPLASSQVSVGAGVALSALMLAIAISICTLLPSQATLFLAIYGAGSLTYSLKLKRILFMDVVSLSLLYVIRVIYGGGATDIKISIWTLAFSLFLFASLATLKRLSELRRMDVKASKIEEYRGYKAIDVNELSSLAAAGSYVAVLVLALYINSPEVTLLYHNAKGLWLLCPLLIYWVSRMGILANRGDLDDDPVSFALKDRTTWFLGVLVVIVLVISTF